MNPLHIEKEYIISGLREQSKLELYSSCKNTVYRVDMEIKKFILLKM